MDVKYNGRLDKVTHLLLEDGTTNHCNMTNDELNVCKQNYMIQATCKQKSFERAENYLKRNGYHIMKIRTGNQPGN